MVFEECLLYLAQSNMETADHIKGSQLPQPVRELDLFFSLQIQDLLLKFIWG